jgi:cysteine desulfurase
VCRFLEEYHSIKVTYLKVDQYGMIDVEELSANLTEKTALVTIMHANNEIGTLQPIHKIHQALEEFKTKTGVKIYLHTDAAQSVGKIWTKVNSSTSDIPNDHDVRGVDMMSICSHKFYGPKGVGALFVRNGSGIKLFKQIHGATHERNHRAGTENVLEIVGLAHACEISSKEIEKRIQDTKHLRDMLYDGLVSNLGQDYVHVNGHPTERLPNTLSVSFPRVEANTLLDAIGDRVAASAGAACHSGDDIQMSYVLEAIGLPVDIAMGTVRFSTGMLLT